ncbi:MAG TPA: hypothetical protein VKM55_28005 [Candidatus Lokiarchaeia archaeon]|nr:hypothetical protein [Candidatus Lokiarchaeia archaeon]
MPAIYYGGSGQQINVYLDELAGVNEGGALVATFEQVGGVTSVSSYLHRLENIFEVSERHSDLAVGAGTIQTAGILPLVVNEVDTLGALHEIATMTYAGGKGIGHDQDGLRVTSIRNPITGIDTPLSGDCLFDRNFNAAFNIVTTGQQALLDAQQLGINLDLGTTWNVQRWRSSRGVQSMSERGIGLNQLQIPCGDTMQDFIAWGNIHKKIAILDTDTGCIRFMNAPGSTSPDNIIPSLPIDQLAAAFAAFHAMYPSVPDYQLEFLQVPFRNLKGNALVLGFVDMDNLIRGVNCNAGTVGIQAIDTPMGVIRTQFMNGDPVLLPAIRNFLTAIASARTSSGGDYCVASIAGVGGAFLSQSATDGYFDMTFAGRPDDVVRIHVIYDPATGAISYTFGRGYMAWTESQKALGKGFDDLPLAMTESALGTDAYALAHAEVNGIYFHQWCGENLDGSIPIDHASGRPIFTREQFNSRLTLQNWLEFMAGVPKPASYSQPQ